METILEINSVPYPIKMLGYIYDGEILIEMIGKTKEQITGLFESAEELVFINADGVRKDCSDLKLDGFIDGAEGDNQWILLK